MTDETHTSSSQDPLMTEDEILPGFSIKDDEENSNFNWLLLVLIAFAIVVISVGLNILIVRKKRK
ncbi:MAG TPA: type VII secretion EssA family protein [Bacillota bacterium]|nr:type VII secretion EssA family protein [Bacillota bacterium]